MLALTLIPAPFGDQGLGKVLRDSHASSRQQSPAAK